LVVDANSLVSCVLMKSKMAKVEVNLILPDSLAHEAEANGLLTPESFETLLREEIRRRRVSQFFEAADRLVALDTPPMTEAEIEAQIQSARKAANLSD
jgi:hypothetical protein